MKFEPGKRDWRAYGPPDVAEHVPGVRQFGSALVGPVDAMAVMARRMGETDAVPAPAVHYTPVNAHPPAIDGLRDYQLDGVSRLVGQLQRDGGVVLADDMGLGKTVQTIATWNSLRRPVPLLVVAPASVRRGWVREFKKWADVDVQLVETGKQAKDVTSDAKVVVTSYELAKKLNARFCPHMIVLDEAHLLRGRLAGRSNFLLELSKVASYKLALTGTPIWSRPRDFWMLLKILFGYRFGTADQFDYAYCGAYQNQWGGKENKGATRLDELKLRLSYAMLRRTKEQVANELPPMTRQIRWVDSTKEATKALEASVLKQLTFSDALNATLDAKLDAAVEAATSAGRFLLFTWQKRHAQLLHEKLNENDVECELITGDLTHAEREAVISRATLSQCGIVATIDSTNAGVDGLQHIADTVIFHAIDYVPIKMAQAEARLHRIGQKNPVTVIYIAMEDSADQFVVETVVEKLDQWKATMGGDATAAMNDTLAAPNVKQSEEAALAAIFAAMEGEAE